MYVTDIGLVFLKMFVKQIIQKIITYLYKNAHFYSYLSNSTHQSLFKLFTGKLSLTNNVSKAF